MKNWRTWVASGLVFAFGVVVGWYAWDFVKDAISSIR